MDEDDDESEKDYGSGLSWFLALGTSIAVVMSYEIHHSLLWALWQGGSNWFYITYRVIAHVFFNGI